MTDFDMTMVRAETIDQPGTIVNSPERGFGEPSDEHLAVINARAPRRMDRTDLFILPAFASNQNLDSHLTRMSDSTLANYVEDFNAGCPVMNSHRTPKPGGLFGGGTQGELPLGRTFQGTLEADESGKRAFALSYLVRNHFPNGQGNLGSNDLIRAVESGIVSDVSIGFMLGSTGRYRCGICESDVTNPWRAACDHQPGVEYDTEQGKRMCFAWVDNAHGRELSTVYKGSTPQANIPRAFQQRAMLLFDSGKLTRFQAHEFEDRTGCRVLQRHPGVELPPPATPAAPPAAQPAAQPVQGGSMEAAEFIRALGIDGVSTIDAARSHVEAIIRERDEAKTRLVQMEPRALMGDRFIKQLISETLDDGVRAMGENFPRESMERMLQNTNDPDALIAMRDGYRRQAQAQFGAQGTETLRQSQPLGGMPVVPGGMAMQRFNSAIPDFENVAPAYTPDAFATGPRR